MTPTEKQANGPRKSHAAIAADVLGSVRELVKIAELPAQAASRLSALFESVRIIVGPCISIQEEKAGTRKRVKESDDREVTFVFPPEEQLDEDARSTDPETAAKAKRLKRFEKRLDEAFDHDREVMVIYTPPDGTENNASVNAERILAITVYA